MFLKQYLGTTGDDITDIILFSSFNEYCLFIVDSIDQLMESITEHNTNLQSLSKRYQVERI